MQYRLRGDRGDVAAAGQAAQEQRVALLRGARLDVQTISAPPEYSRTQRVSGRRASVSAIRCALPGAACSRTSQFTQPARCAVDEAEHPQADVSAASRR